MLLSHSHWMATVVRTVVIFKSDNRRESKSVPLTNRPSIARFKSSWHTTENRGTRRWRASEDGAPSHSGPGPDSPLTSFYEAGVSATPNPGSREELRRLLLFLLIPLMDRSLPSSHPPSPRLLLPSSQSPRPEFLPLSQNPAQDCHRPSWPSKACLVAPREPCPLAAAFRPFFSKGPSPMGVLGSLCRFPGP